MSKNTARRADLETPGLLGDAGAANPREVDEIVPDGCGPSPARALQNALRKEFQAPTNLGPWPRSAVAIVVVTYCVIAWASIAYGISFAL